jgi:hypothetical protein
MRCELSDSSSSCSLPCSLFSVLQSIRKTDFWTIPCTYFRNVYFIECKVSPVCTATVPTVSETALYTSHRVQEVHISANYFEIFILIL